MDLKALNLKRTPVEGQPEMADTAIDLAGCRLALDPAGALWIAASRTLVVADLHLEKGSSMARRQVFLPPYDTHATLQALGLLIARRNPQRIICLGDSFHDDGGSGRLDASARALIHRLQRGREWIWVAGNHDRQTPSGLGGACADDVLFCGLQFRHEPSENAGEGEIFGHLHPSAKIRRRGRSVRRRAFVTDGRRLALPAFGALTGGLNILHPAVSGLFEQHRARVFMLGNRRLFSVATAALRPD